MTPQFQDQIDFPDFGVFHAIIWAIAIEIGMAVVGYGVWRILCAS